MVALCEVILKAVIPRRGRHAFFLSFFKNGKYCPSRTQLHSLCWQILSTKDLNPIPPTPKSQITVIMLQNKRYISTRSRKDNAINILHHLHPFSMTALTAPAPQLRLISNQPCFASKRTMQTASFIYCVFSTSHQSEALIIFLSF